MKFLPSNSHWRGAGTALLAAALFGASTPLSKMLLRSLSVVWLPGLLYLGSGVGLLALRLLYRSTHESKREAKLPLWELPWLAGAVFSGGVIAPVLLVLGLRGTASSTASLMLNLEGVFTALLAWFVFRESFDRRIFCGMALIVAGGVLLSWEGTPAGGFPWSALAIAGACLAWALDNNLTRKVSASDPMNIAMWKGFVSGSINTGIAWALTGTIPPIGHIAAAGLLGFLSYGVSLTLFVLALRQLGSARTGAYFSAAPFVGVILSFTLIGETPSLLFWVAAVLMTIGIWLHLTENHAHEHVHDLMEHEHRHTHDEHHQHDHQHLDASRFLTTHSHRHRHSRLAHTHPHVPDIHHRHSHETGDGSPDTQGVSDPPGRARFERSEAITCFRSVFFPEESAGFSFPRSALGTQRFREAPASPAGSRNNARTPVGMGTGSWSFQPLAFPSWSL